MKVLSNVVLSCVLFFGAGAMAFATDTRGVSYDFSSSYYTPPVTNVVDVPVTKEIRDWFTHHGVDGSIIDSPKLSNDKKTDIDRVLVNGNPAGGNGANVGGSTDNVNQDALESLIRPALEKALSDGVAQKARMIIGHRVWALTAVSE